MMKTNILTTAAALSDRELLTRLVALAGKEREATVELLAHLAALDSRPALYAAEGHGSLFRYCTDALRLSEDAACTRIEAARACRGFPAILDRLSRGSLSLTTVRRLAPHLTPENHESVLARAEGRGRHEIEALIAELAPRPDVPSSIRKLSVPTLALRPTTRAGMATNAPPAIPAAVATPAGPEPARAALVAAPRPVVQPIAPERYRVQFTIGPEAHQTLRRLQALLRREIASGDPGAIVERALTLLLAEVEKKKLGAAAASRGPIRSRTDEPARKPALPSRYVPRAVRRAVWRRDGTQCAFVSPAGRRCQERTFLELHHVQPHARGGPATVANLLVLCRLCRARHKRHYADCPIMPTRPFRTAVAAELIEGYAA